MFQPTFTFDGIAAIITLLAGGITGYYGIIRKVDRHETQIKHTQQDYEDLRRGRGLILGRESDWPDAVRRCFGYGRHDV
jgi:hypothetical protein